MRCLIDTGSQITTITETLFKTLSDCQLLDVSNWIKITGANHLGIPYLGYTELRLTLGQHTLEKVGIIVVRDPMKQKQKLPGLLSRMHLRLLSHLVVASSTYWLCMKLEFQQTNRKLPL